MKTATKQKDFSPTQPIEINRNQNPVEEGVAREADTHSTIGDIRRVVSFTQRVRAKNISSRAVAPSASRAVFTFLP